MKGGDGVASRIEFHSIPRNDAWIEWQHLRAWIQRDRIPRIGYGDSSRGERRPGRRALLQRVAQIPTVPTIAASATPSDGWSPPESVGSATGVTSAPLSSRIAPRLPGRICVAKFLLWQNATVGLTAKYL